MKSLVDDILRDSNGSATASFIAPKFRLLSVFAVAVCVVAGWIGHFMPFSDVFGSGAADFVVRQSEAYAMIALIIVFWAIFAPIAATDGKQWLLDRSDRTRLWLWIGWLLSLIAASIAMVLWESGPGPFVTQKESTAAVVAISWYLGWSRGLYSTGNSTHPGRSVKTIRERASYYGAAAILLLLSFTGVPMAIFGAGIGDWLAENNEAFLALILIPLYFDLFERPRSWMVAASWYAVLVTVPLAVQLTGQSGWTAEVTEAFIAAIGISLFFDVIRISAATQKNVTVPDALTTKNASISKGSTKSQVR